MAAGHGGLQRAVKVPLHPSAEDDSGRRATSFQRRLIQVCVTDKKKTPTNLS